MAEARIGLLELAQSGSGLWLITGTNGSGKSNVARALAAGVAGSRLLSAESQQAFFEAELAADESNFAQGADTSRTVAELLGDCAREHPLVAAFRLTGLWVRGYRLLSTGEARKVLLLQAVLSAPSLLILDDPFDGLDREACAELARAIMDVAGRLPVVVASAFDARSFPFLPEQVREVCVVERGQVSFRGTAQAFLERSGDGQGRRPRPPVELGSFYEPLAADAPLVQLRQGSVRYGEHVVFEGLEFDIRVGQHTLIEGPNGSGKSSLLGMITGDHPQAYSNALSLFGRRRGSGESVWEIKKNVGVVSGQLHRDYRVAGSVEEVLVSGLFDSIGVYQRIEPSHRERARAWLAWLELGVAPSAPFRELSFGQQRLVLVARAAIKVPPLVVFDEPTSGLDEDNRARVLELAESLCTQRKSTLLMVTHRPDERAFWQARIGGPIVSLAGTRGDAD
ncbi:MAG TPA: ATP-binding cassette domain-containing protein [Polyangiaceae bacterium]|nr:ATP-binding cassette domain-containing protein [Polyangiaceae bacterium]